MGRELVGFASLTHGTEATERPENAYLAIGTPSSLATLPPELLIEVFIRCSSGHLPFKRWDALKCITHVCRYWRQVALDAPLLWKHLVLFSHWPYEACQELLNRSLRIPLHLTVEYDPYKPRAIQLPESDLERVVYLHLHSYGYGAPQGTHDLPVLRVLHVESGAGSSSQSIPLLDHDSPLAHLESITSRDTSFVVISHFFRPSLRSLYMTCHYITSDGIPSTAEFISALGSLPLLELLHVAHLFIPADSHSPQLPTVELPSLRILYLFSFPAACSDILDHLAIPIEPFDNEGQMYTRDRHVTGQTDSRSNPLSFLKDMSTSVATKLRGIGVIGAVPVCDTLRVVADIRNPVPLEIEAREGRKLILAWSLHYFHETGLNIKDVLDCIFSATPAPLLARLRTVEVVVQENDIHVPEYLSLIDQVEALHLTGAQGIITEIVRQHLACTTSHDSAGNPVLQPSMTLPFPNLRFITLDNIRLSAKAVGHCDLRTALFLMCALRKNEGAEVTLVLINGR